MKSREKNIYRRVFTVYTAVIILLIVSLDIYFLKYFSDSTKDKNLYINQQMVNEVAGKLDEDLSATNRIIDDIYYHKDVLFDMLNFINMDLSEYKKQRLDTISESTNMGNIGTELFIKKIFNSYENLENVAIVSFSREMVSTFNRKNQIKYEKINDYNQYVNKKIIPHKDSITYIRNINNTENFNSAGLLMLTFNMSNVESIVKEYDSYNKVSVIDKDRNTIYDSNGEYNLYYGNIIDKKELLSIKGGNYLNAKYQDEDITVIGRISKGIADNIPFGVYVTLICLDLVAFIMAEAIIYLKIKKLNNRMNKVIVAMDEVKDGNFDISIDVGEENDELSYIAFNFNEMCKRLKEHIEKSYLAEINQKNAEMKALQSQINPHFLYNTLEVIRMKAICSGNKEVGKMLYNLATLFRSQLKEKDIITIKSEVDYCKKYLELFKFRYKEKFNYEIYCDEYLLGNKVIKFILQPLVENYLIHGIRLEDDDNMIVISIVSEDEDILIHIEDNGKGIDVEKIDEINEKLSEKKHNTRSIGILNVNERIKTLYGEKYGVLITKDINLGTKILVKIPKI